ncbi:MAG: glutaminyl-peptide cyclotransferase [Bacteroidales bacterium]|nr:glutaminyl-peptide cyclotransferase [Bacteroidales bacterium]
MKKICLLLLLLPALMGASPVSYRAVAVREYPHDPTAYTQGLFFKGDTLCESTGQYGESSFRMVDLRSGKPFRKLNFARKYFVEGSVALGGSLFILTWMNRVIFEYEAGSLKYLSTRAYPYEGWGLCTDGSSLVASDGSSKLYFINPSGFKLEKVLEVSLEGRPVRFLNELEWIDGRIWANVYTTDLIVVIDPENGEVEATVDCGGLLPQKLRTSSTDVLNGIAVSDGGAIYLTGKNWPRLYEVELEKL